MEKIRVLGTPPSGWETALVELREDLGMTLSEDGLSVTACRGDCLAVDSDGSSVTITWAAPIQFYRALSLIPVPLAPCHIQESPAFESTGVMFDCSRNAVLTPESLRFFLRKMALMGLNLGMMYTEDTYEVPEQPFFGYKRGRYTYDELKAIDDYAFLFGIELIPCIQTLGHLDRVMHWPAYHGVREDSSIIEPDREESYTMLEQLIRAASAPYRSRRIHLGMDEAFGVGLGAHLYHFGYENPNNILGRHLKRLLEITDKLGLQAMMWSDMYFAIDGKNYHSEGDPSDAAIAAVDSRATLVYWDYYQSREEMYLDALKKHSRLPAPTVFAGGIWTWIGPAPAYEISIRNTVAALSACRKAGVPLVVATCWGDDGQECNMLAALPGMQLYGEMAYTGVYDPQALSDRFRRCCHGELSDFLALSELNTLPGLESRSNDPSNICKILLYQDPLVQLFEKDLEGFRPEEHFAGLVGKYALAARKNPQYAAFFDFYTALAHTLTLKSRWHAAAAQAVRERDLAAAGALAEDIPAAMEAVEALRKVWRTLWESTNKPFGFEVIDFRLGGVRARLATAGERMAAFARGEIADIPELSGEVLPYRRSGDFIGCTNTMRDLLTAARLDHPD